MKNEQLDQIADRIARRVFEIMNNRPEQYQGKPEAYKAGFQGQYADEHLRESGLYERERERLGYNYRLRRD